jgi:Kinase binding protein CGI-121
MQEAGALLTHSVHADIVVNHSGAKHIAAALNTFGINATTQRLLMAKLDATEADLEAIKALVKGEQAPVPHGSTGNDKKMRKAFKVVAPELQVGSMLDAAICKSACKRADHE